MDVTLDNVGSYAELKMRLDLAGSPDHPPEYLFDHAMALRKLMKVDGFDSMGWKNFCDTARWRLRRGMSLSAMNMLNSGLM